MLYVAMTRARERLYITGAPRYGAEKVLEKAALLGNPHAGSMATEGASYLEWVLTALQRPDTAEFATVQIVPEGESPAPVDGDHGTPTLNVPTALDVEAELSKLKQRLDFVYPHQHLTRLPAKLSVSRLSPVALDVFDSDADTTHLPVGGEDTEQLLHAFERLPLFEKRTATAAERGTATHEFLQFCDFEAVCRHGVAAELERLISKRFLPEAARDAVRVDELERFFESDLYRAISCARKVYRETRFHLFLPAARFTADPAFSAQLEGVRLPVQGVIDLFFIDDKGQLVLCDYKTDRLSPAELRDPQKAAKALFARHGEQLAYYTEALAEIFGKRPERVLIYSLPAGRALEQPQ